MLAYFVNAYSYWVATSYCKSHAYLKDEVKSTVLTHSHANYILQNTNTAIHTKIVFHSST